MPARRSLLASLVLLIAACAVPLVAAPESKPGAERKPRLNVYFPKGFDDAAWQKAAFDKVLGAWKVKGLPAAGAKTVLIAFIGRDGQLTGARDQQLAGNAEWDQAAIAALKAAAPFPAVPASWPHASLEVHWHFEAS